MRFARAVAGNRGPSVGQKRTRSTLLLSVMLPGIGFADALI
jgi:hypothetical protein